jgi:hypothetical protein
LAAFPDADVDLDAKLFTDARDVTRRVLAVASKVAIDDLDLHRVRRQ